MTSGGNIIDPDKNQDRPSQINNNLTASDLSSSISDTKTSLYKGDSLYNLTMYSGAMTYYDKALDINPYKKEALKDKGNALNGLGNNDEAIPYIDKSLVIDTNFTEAKNNKDLALQKSNNG